MKAAETAIREKTVYEPYKYVLQDAGNILIGAKYTYEELLSAEALNFKLKAIISQYILKESAKETSLESELYYLSEESFVYKTLWQLKARVKLSERTRRRTLTGKEKEVYKERILPLRELCAIDPKEKERRGMLLTELMISKLALMSFTV